MPRLPNGDWLGEDLTEAKQQVLALWPELCSWAQAAVTKWKNRLPAIYSDPTYKLGALIRVPIAVQDLENATPNIPNIPDGAGAMAFRLWDLCRRAEELTDAECAEFLTDLESLTGRNV